MVGFCSFSVNLMAEILWRMIAPFSFLVNLNKPALQTRLGIKYLPKKFIDVETEKFPV
jgi:hypothetical protein